MAGAKIIIKLFFNILFMVFIISPILLLIFIPFKIYRLLIILLSKIFRRDFVEIVPARDAVFANDDLLIKPACTTLVPIKLQGDIEIEDIRVCLQKAFATTNLDNKSSSNNKNQTRFSTMKQYFVSWGGFMFRKWEKDFDIDKHVREWKNENGTLVTENDLYNLRRLLLQEPYKPEISPWQIVLVRNYEDSQGLNTASPFTSVVIGRFHHGVVDGFSLVQIFIDLFARVETKSLVTSKSLTWIQNLQVFGAAYALAPAITKSQMPKIHPANIFHPNNTKLKGIRHPVDRTVSVSLIKKIAKQTGTSFSAVLLEGLAGGIRNYFIDCKKPVPDVVDMSLPFPWPGHPDKIGNHFTIAVLQLPVGIFCPFQRLQNLQKKFLKLKKSTVPAFNYMTVPIAGMLPNLIMDLAIESGPSSILLSNIPGPTEQLELFDRPVIQPLFEGGYNKALLGMGVSMLSFNGILSISINPDEGIVPTKDQAIELLQCITNEFDILNYNTMV